MTGTRHILVARLIQDPKRIVNHRKICKFLVHYFLMLKYDKLCWLYGR